MIRPAALRLATLVALAATALVVAGGATGCRRSAETIGSSGNPVVLVLSPAHGSRASAARLGDELTRRSGLAVRIEVAPSASRAVAAVGTPQVDGGILSLFEYLLARQEFGVEARLQLLRHDGARSYRGVMLVRDDAPYRSLADLGGARIAYVDQASTTGHLLAARALADAGVAAQGVYVGSHEAALEALRAGKVAAAATYARDELPPGLRQLAVTGEAPNEPVFFHPRLAADKRERVVAALVELAATPDGHALLGELADATGVVAVTDELYDQVREMLAATQHRLEDVVPGAWRLRNRRDVSTADLGPI